MVQPWLAERDLTRVCSTRLGRVGLARVGLAWQSVDWQPNGSNAGPHSTVRLVLPKSQEEIGIPDLPRMTNDLTRPDQARLGLAFPRWLHTYNHHRSHTALAGHPPASRVPNLSGQYT
ncbi:hypothetical protein GCM10022222_60600 [Amycolatopsis ultiminotia]|uniref:Integrase catalytic domain-containing protein n=1 Tax=Amycolatopsis ultiminotia TaxID=543629 RepID=A0ABP6XLY9_9PSEU